MVRQETPIASLEQALSRAKARPFGLPAAPRAMILKLGQGERKLPAGKVSPLERQLHGEAILEMTSPPAASQRRPTKIIQDRQETANNTWQPTPAKPPNRQTGSIQNRHRQSEVHGIGIRFVRAIMRGRCWRWLCHCVNTNARAFHVPNWALHGPASGEPPSAFAPSFSNPAFVLGRGGHYEHQLRYPCS